ncbi:MAG: hypothetical protein CMJ83_18650 [Planctomycetes bacterium]|nr:hypothetical protein [Planctomycetota bacterium]
MAFVSSFRHHVRSYELDPYGHVNNAVHMQWLEHGRSRLLQDKGFDFTNVEDRWGVRFVTASVKIDYKASLLLDDDVEVTTTVARFGRTSVTLQQQIVRRDPDGSRTLAGAGQCVIVFTDPTMTQPVPIPDGFKELYA